MKAELRESRRAELLDAAAGVFARKGYRASSIEDIIERAGIARGTFYLYFESKLEIFLAIMDESVKGLREAAQAESEREFDARDPRGALKAALRAWLEHFAQRRDRAAVVIRHGASVDPDYQRKVGRVVDAMYGRWEILIRRAQKAGVARASFEPKFLRVCLIGMFSQLLLEYVVEDPAADLDALAEQWTELLSRGLFAR